MRILIDEDLSNRCILKSLERAKSFTWERCAMETLKAFNEVYDGSTFLKREGQHIEDPYGQVRWYKPGTDGGGLYDHCP
jgi:hypothetical protein